MWQFGRMLRGEFPTQGLFATLLIGAAFLVGCAPSSAADRSSSTTTPPSPTPAYTATPAPPAGTGWRKAGPSDLQSLFFAPDDPLAAYTCLNRAGGQRGPLTFGVSHDGGHTWQVHVTDLPDTDCQMAVSPTDAKTIAMAANWSKCSGDGCVTQPVDISISHDGGAIWTAAAAPVGGLRDWGTSVELAWIGDTLFVGTNGDSATEGLGQAHPVIAASVNGAPFASVGADILRGTPGMRLGNFLPLRATLYIKLASDSANPSTSGDIYLKTDASAATFTRVTFEAQGSHVHALAAGLDGKTLIGQIDPPGSASSSLNPLAVSADGGLTWHALPAFPPAQFCCYVDYTYGAADGTVIAEIQVYLPEQRNYEATGIFALRPGAGVWVYVASPPAGSIILTISSDVNGRPIAAWAPGFGGGLPYHPLA